MQLQLNVLWLQRLPAALLYILSNPSPGGVPQLRADNFPLVTARARVQVEGSQVLEALVARELVARGGASKVATVVSARDPAEVPFFDALVVLVRQLAKRRGRGRARFAHRASGHVDVVIDEVLRLSTTPTK